MKYILLFLTFINVAWSGIRTIQSIEEVKGQISQDDLVFVDLGYTTQYPAAPMMARSEARSFVLDKTAQMEETSFKRISTLLLANTKWALVEDAMKGFIDSLQAQGIALLGITGGGRLPYVGKLPYDPSLLPVGMKQIKPIEQYYVEALLSLGVDFSVSAPQGESLDNSMKENHSVYQNGILFLCHQSMGDIIPIFYNTAPQKYAKVVAIDDEIFYLRHLEEMLAKENIPFEGYYYVHYAEMPKNYDQKIAELELQHLIDKNEVLSDEKARLLQ